jgi:uncharacterized membrane protein YkvA (DUF1232 family)
MKMKNLRKRTILVFLASIAYICMPVDVLPDALPFIGPVDDSLIFGYFVKLFMEDRQNYKNSKKR